MYGKGIDSYTKDHTVDVLGLLNKTCTVGEAVSVDKTNVIVGIYNSDDYGIYHCGMTPKNVILDSDKKFHALLDLDEIAIADRNYAFAMMAAKYQKSGHNIMDLIQYYEEQTGIKLDHKKIKRIVETVNIGKHILYNGAKSR